VIDSMLECYLKSIQNLMKVNSLHMASFVSLFVLICSFSPVYAQTSISGTVFYDENENRTLDIGEQGISNVLVSNGSEVVKTDRRGNYTIETEENSILFVIKPRGWQNPSNQNNIPQFFAVNSTEGATGSVYNGFPHTGRLYSPVNFPLYPQEESDQFRVLVFGDTQPRTIEEVNYIAHDSVEEVIGTDAAFGVTLGDLVFDDLNLFEPLNQVIAQVGVPWRHVLGNHDIDFSADDNWNARGAYLRTYGPSWYAFTVGNTHFITIDNIRWITNKNERFYRTGLGEKQMNFVRNFLLQVPDDELVVFMAHIPWVDSTPWADEAEREELFGLMADHGNTITFAAHTHRHYHRFVGEEDSWPGEGEHHMVSMATVCGSWWTGAHDEYGIPHSLMRDGTPTGYGFLDIDGADWKFSFKAARRPADFQMHISAPSEVAVSASDTIDVYANIFNALPDATVEMRVGSDDEWQKMMFTEEPDPIYAAMKMKEDRLIDVDWLRTGDVNENARHLWKKDLPAGLKPGTYTIFIRARDKWHSYEGHRILRVIE